MPACVGIDDDESAAMAVLLRDTQSALSLLGDDEHLAAMRRRARRGRRARAGARAVAGRRHRVLADASVFDAADTEAARVARACRPGAPPLDAAAFVEGFLAGSGTVLVHDPVLLGVIDRWLATSASDAFTQTAAAAAPHVRFVRDGRASGDRRPVRTPARRRHPPGRTPARPRTRRRRPRHASRRLLGLRS